MDYSYRIGVSADDQTLADAVGRFAQTELAPRASELDATEGSVTCHLKALAALGVMGMNIPERWGGQASAQLACCWHWLKYPARAQQPRP